MDTPAKICQLDNTSRSNQHIFWFDVTMDNAMLMKIIDCTAELSNDIGDQFITFFLFSASEEIE